MRTELVWEGKYDEFGNRRELNAAGLALPLQRIETIDEPRSRAEAQGTLFDEQKAHRDDFRNRLIWGDNKLVIAALLEEFRGKIDLIYIDPPFDVGADFTMSVPIGDTRETVQKDQSVLEMVAYRDVWGKGTSSYFHTMFERLALMRELLTEEGSIWVHVGPQVSHQIKIIMDEVFGADNFLSEIVWKRTSAHGDTKSFGHVTEQIFGFSKATKHSIFNVVRVPFSEDYVASEYRYVDSDGRRFRRGDLTGAGVRYGETGLPWRGLNPTEINRHWGNPPSELDRLDKEGLIYWPPKGKWPHLKIFLDDRNGSPATNIWTDIPPVNNVAKEGTGYATQKPEALLDRPARSLA
jgi:adenine-specific DNA-methyltransferase